MKNVFLISTIALASFSLTGVASACDMHGGGYGFGMRNASWEAYSPKVSTIDPIFGDDEMTPLSSEAAVAPKAKPSFSNAASRAAQKAKAKPRFSSASNLAVEKAKARLAKKSGYEVAAKKAASK